MTGPWSPRLQARNQLKPTPIARARTRRRRRLHPRSPCCPTQRSAWPHITSWLRRDAGCLAPGLLCVTRVRWHRHRCGPTAPGASGHLVRGPCRALQRRHGAALPVSDLPRRLRCCLSRRAGPCQLTPSLSASTAIQYCTRTRGRGQLPVQHRSCSAAFTFCATQPQFISWRPAPALQCSPAPLTTSLCWRGGSLLRDLRPVWSAERCHKPPPGGRIPSGTDRMVLRMTAHISGERRTDDPQPNRTLVRTCGTQMERSNIKRGKWEGYNLHSDEETRDTGHPRLALCEPTQGVLAESSMRGRQHTRDSAHMTIDFLAHSTVHAMRANGRYELVSGPQLDRNKASQGSFADRRAESCRARNRGRLWATEAPDEPFVDRKKRTSSKRNPKSATLPSQSQPA